MRAAETAWVIDGATDVGDIRIFDSAESDAAWYAGNAFTAADQSPALDEDAETYWRAVLDDVRGEVVERARMNLDAIPGGSRPCASGIWLRRRPEAQRAEVAWLGDCVAIIAAPGSSAQVFGELAGIKDEVSTAQSYHALAPEGRKRMLQEGRARATASGTGGVFSVHPDAADHMQTAEIGMPVGRPCC